MSPARPRVGISACLLGDPVRYDGGHKRDAYLADALGVHVDWIPVCPELALGMGVPRPPIRLEEDEGGVHLRVVATGADLTEEMARWSADQGAVLAEQDLAGFVLKSRSPSCGLDDAAVSDSRGEPVAARSGAFAHDLQIAWPSLPLATEETLRDPVERACFVSRIFAHAGLAAAVDAPALLRHHERHRLLLASRDLESVPLLDDLAEAGERHGYTEGFHAALGRVPAHDDHARALRFACMRASGRLDAEARSQVATVLDAYTAGSASLATAVGAVRDVLPDVAADDAYLHPPPPVLAAYRDL